MQRHGLNPLTRKSYHRAMRTKLECTEIRSDKNLYTSALLSILLSACTVGWSRGDTAWQVANYAAMGADLYQTARAGGIVDNCREGNPVIGPCGERMDPAQYMLLAAVLHTSIAAALPPKWRRTFQAFTLGLESTVVYFNWRNR